MEEFENKTRAFDAGKIVSKETVNNKVLSKEVKPIYVTFEQEHKFREKGCDVETTETKYRHELLQQWQVVEWASLVHNIDIEARPVRYAGDIKTSYYQPYINGCIVNMSKFATKQEVLSEAINEFLKMI